MYPYLKGPFEKCQVNILIFITKINDFLSCKLINELELSKSLLGEFKEQKRRRTIVQYTPSHETILIVGIFKYNRMSKISSNVQR